MFKKYPFLTSRSYFQLQFLLNCLKHNNIQEYFLTKNDKYKNNSKEFSLCMPTTIPHYFSEWLAGFIEAEGSFCVKSNKSFAFIIGLNNDYYLLNCIRHYYNIPAIQIQAKKIKALTKKNKIISFKNTEFSVISIASKQGISNVIQHCKPLLQGHKYQQMIEFCSQNPTLFKLYFSTNSVLRRKLRNCVMLSCYYER